jgi:uncharacterized secreted protein with C-terminal beta-propeller domain
MNDKTYEIVISFLEPSQAVVTLHASSEEDAVNKLKAELEGQVENLTILNIKEISETMVIETIEKPSTELH